MKGHITKADRIFATLLLVAICFRAVPAQAFLSRDNASQPGKAQPPSDAAEPAQQPSLSDQSNPDAYDGRWMFTSAGCRNTGSIGAIIKHGRVIVRGGSGQVSPDGTIHTVGAGGGMTLTAEGHLAAETGSGTFDRSDGCIGTWIAIRRH
jgi:hypothetical protein